MLRVAVWWFGIAMMIAPLMLAVLGGPSDVMAVFDWRTYVLQYKEILFIGIAVGGLAVTDSCEVVSMASRQNDWRRDAILVLLFLVVLEVVFCAVWYGRAAEGRVVVTADAIMAVGIVVIMILEGFALRCMVWTFSKR